jgi:hypothetical protein
MGNQEDKKTVVRKPDPSRRRDIHVVTFKKIEGFLKEQTQPIFKSELVRLIGVNYDSLNIALEMLPIKTDKEGRIYLEKKEKKNV